MNTNNNEILTLQAMLNDVTGNQRLGDARKMSGYLKSISLLADAMARRTWQQFELEVLDELRDMSNAEVRNGVDAKGRMALREFELSDLTVKVSDFLAQAGSDCFVSKEDAAGSLRAIADAIEAKDSVLFPKPMTEEEARAYAESIGATYSSGKDAEKLLATLVAKVTAGPKASKKRAGSPR